jgi:hypothetical protein
VGEVRIAAYQRHCFAVRYTHQDIALLAEVDRVHERLSGPATRRILQRAYEQFGDPRYQRLAGISVSHVYNLRASARYRNQAAVFEPTRSSAAGIGDGAGRIRGAAPDFCASTRCIRGTGRGPRVCITSMQWMR